MIRRSSMIALECLLALAAAALIALGVAWWRLAQGPVELNFIREHVQAELSEARSGRPVNIDRVEMAWSREAGALELLAIGISVNDQAGAVLSRSEEARIELGLAALLTGRIAVVRADFLGGDVSITRKNDGAVEVAFGPPGSPPDIVVPPPPENETLEARVSRLLDGLGAAFRPVGPGGKLKSVSLSGARLAIIDETSGGRWTADAATMQLSREGDALAFAAEALLEGPQGQAPATFRITTDTAFQAAIVEFGARDVRPRALLPASMLGPFAALDTPMTSTISIGLDRTSGINRLEGEVALGKGVADMAGGQFSLDGGSLRGRYDLASDELVLDQLALNGERTRIQGEVRIRDASRILKADPGEPAEFNVVLPALRLDIPGVLAAPIDLTEVQATGAVDSAASTVRFTRLHARAGDGAMEGAGRLYWGRVAGPQRRARLGVELQARQTGVLSVQQVMQMWPVPLGEGARHYIAESLVAGRVTDGRVALDIRPGDLGQEALPNRAIDVRFNVADGEFRYINTMSPVTHGRGRGQLQGNRFDMWIDEAQLNGLALTQGRIEAPRFKPHGATMTISARAEGNARGALDVLRQEPLSLGDRLPVDVASASGRTVVDLSLQRPMIENVPVEAWRYSIDGRIENFAGNMTARRVAFTQGNLTVRGNQDGVVVSGPVRAGTSDVTVAWNETFNVPQGQASSNYEISGDFDAGDLVRLGYSVAQYAQGRIGVTITGRGNGFDVDRGNIQLDLRNAAIESPWSFWTKRAGLPASARFDIERQQDGTIAFNNLEARGGGLNAQGRVRIAPRDERIVEADLTRLVVEGRSDARLQATRDADGAFNVTVRGALFDAQPFMDNSDTDGDPAAQARAAQEPPLRADIQVARLKLRGGATLADAHVNVGVARSALTLLTAEGRSPGGRAFSLALGPRPGNPAGDIAFRSEDAGFATRALTGADNVVGGTVTAEGTWRATAPNRGQFVVRMRDFNVQRLPAMAQLVSSVGSLTGLADTLAGEGIGFSSLDAPILFANNRLTISESRASGPALGLTASGVYDMRRDNLDIDGVVAPSPGLNLSMLGQVPVLGELVVSRRGEGVFGMTYSVNGPVATPRVGVNPLSAMAPGIFRRMFEPTQRRPREEEEPARAAVAEGDAAEAP